MNKNLVCTALAAAALCTSFGASAQDYQRDHRNADGTFVQDRDHNFMPPEQQNGAQPDARAYVQPDARAYQSQRDQRDQRAYQWQRDHRDQRAYESDRDHRDGRNDRWDREHRDQRAMGAYGDHHWRRGDRLPDEYRRREYVVNDWDRYHLQAPPRGYQWMNVDGNYMLVAIASGLIANLVLGAR